MLSRGGAPFRMPGSLSSSSRCSMVEHPSSIFTIQPRFSEKRLSCWMSPTDSEVSTTPKPSMEASVIRTVVNQGMPRWHRVSEAMPQER